MLPGGKVRPEEVELRANPCSRKWLILPSHLTFWVAHQLDLLEAVDGLTNIAPSTRHSPNRFLIAFIEVLTSNPSTSALPPEEVRTPVRMEISVVLPEQRRNTCGERKVMSNFNY